MLKLQSITLEQADPERHFAAIATLMNTQETEPNTASTAAEWYGKHQEDGAWFKVASTPWGQVLGFNGLYRSNLNLEAYYSLYLVVDEAARRQGIGSLLYDDLLHKAAEVKAHTLRVRVRDTCAEGERFATRRGFRVKKHSIEMLLDLTLWDDRPYKPVLDALRAQGFVFTSMAELGDTQDARHKLFALNNAAAATDPGSGGIAPWASFEEFERDVCESSWYHPDGQIVAIDGTTGTWAAMSAITIFETADHAYNLFTGTEAHYRGRKLAQAVKTLALSKARQYGTGSVRTSHNSENAAMIAIDNKLGYVRTPGVLVMEKELDCV